jgi:GNAT superfamily N-acetyltransferase
MTVVQVDAEVGRALRMSVLRPHEPAGRPMYGREQEPSTLHFAAVGRAEAVLAVGSVMPEEHPRDPRPDDWRIRGMATRPELRGRGMGSAVLAAIEGAAGERGARRLWCNARTGARRFYERAGFAAEGREYEIEGIGAHFLMSKTL